MYSNSYFVYILTNPNRTVLYIGITNDLVKRVFEHKNKLVKGFTKKYNVGQLLYYEVVHDVTEAIVREKKLKAGSRKKENRINPNHESFISRFI